MLTRKLPSSFKVCQVVTKGPVKDRREKRKTDKRFDKFLRKFELVYRSQLLESLTMKWFVNYAIEIGKRSKLSHRRLYQISTAEQKAGKEYIENLLKKGMRKRS